MYYIEELLQKRPYSLNKQEKKKVFDDYISKLSKFHYEHSEYYRRICDLLRQETPLLPVRLFKEYDLLSVPKEEIVKTLTSSGTTGQAVSKIFLDKRTSAVQTKVLTKITSDFLGNKRLPMIILDTNAVIKNRQLFSARGAGILGFSMLGYDIIYAFDENMKLDIDKIEKYLEKHHDEEILLFGFTFMIWQHFYHELLKNKKRLNLEKGIMLHGGGWKKLIDQSVDNIMFKKCLQDVCGIKQIYNYYGMVEQTGSIYMECEHGRLHTSIFSDINILNHKDFSLCKQHQKGIIQLISLLPMSYPGHNILTEDIGEITGEDDCPCGRLGKTFMIHGRIKSAEVRGCSDTYDIKN
jgi:phenylacetate-coenzyme A ligase PaaK-like adenylate-forming protein